MNPRPPKNLPLNTATWAWLALLVLALLIYALGLGGQYNPSNGDELVYTHIARLTAASGHWLPLVSDLDHMRNTKPPLLFWQAMVAGDWGQHWNQAALRTPSLIYTLLITAALAWTVYQISRDLRSATIAACVYLAFFCTFRYGRSYLTSAPESFWLNLPVFYLLWQRLRPAPARHDCDLGWLAHLGFGLALGLGLAYKSFALIAPAAATLWAAQLLSQPRLNWRSTLKVTGQVSLSAALALGVFALWFVLDPDPRAVWQEFIIGENAGKLSSGLGYWHNAMWGGSYSLWAHLLGYVENAGLLAFVTLGLAAVGLQAWRQPSPRPKMSPHTVILLTWLAVWLLVFSLPSQRSARYVIPAMPAVAMLIALHWQRLARGWFVASLLLCSVFMVVLARIAWAASDIGMGSPMQLNATLLATAVGLALVLAGLLKPGWTRACTVAACLAVYAVLGLTTAPLNGASGRYPDALVAQLRQARMAVPRDFNGQFEQFEFLLPGNQWLLYPHDAPATELPRLLASHDAVIWLQSKPDEQAPPCAPGCTVLGTRWDVKARHKSGDITLANLGTPQSWLFRREWLLSNAAPPAAHAKP